MTWNYRVMRYKGRLAIYDVYYDDEGHFCGYSENPTSPRGDSIEDLQEALLRYAEALNEPILDYDN